MSKNNTKFMVLVFSILTVFSLLFIKTSSADTTDSHQVDSSLTVNMYVSISLTSALDSGITFGNLDPGNSNNQSTTCTDYACNISVSGDTNVNVDIVVRSNANLTRDGGAETIPNVNYTWNSTDSSEMPTEPGSFAMDETDFDYVNKVGSNMAPSTKRTIQFWVDIPATQESGSYNNTLTFCANQQGTTNCG